MHYNHSYFIVSDINGIGGRSITTGRLNRCYGPYTTNNNVSYLSTWISQLNESQINIVNPTTTMDTMGSMDDGISKFNKENNQYFLKFAIIFFSCFFVY